MNPSDILIHPATTGSDTSEFCAQEVIRVGNSQTQSHVQLSKANNSTPSMNQSQTYRNDLSELLFNFKPEAEEEMMQNLERIKE